MIFVVKEQRHYFTNQTYSVSKTKTSKTEVEIATINLSKHNQIFLFSNVAEGRQNNQDTFQYVTQYSLG